MFSAIGPLLGGYLSKKEVLRPLSKWFPYLEEVCFGLYDNDVIGSLSTSLCCVCSYLRVCVDYDVVFRR